MRFPIQVYINLLRQADENAKNATLLRLPIAKKLADMEDIKSNLRKKKEEMETILNGIDTFLQNRIFPKEITLKIVQF